MSDFKSSLDCVKFSRVAFSALVDKYSNEQLNKIPEGFKNNMLWNFAHSIVSLDYFCYFCTGNPSEIPLELSKKYVRGTKPEGPADDEEIQFWKDLAKSSLEKLEKDLKAGIFVNYKPIPLGYGHSVNNFEDALNFSAFHEGTHFGYALAMKRYL